MFPREIIRNIARFLSYQDLQAVSVTCVSWAVILRDVTFWHELLILRRETYLPTDLRSCRQRHHQLSDSNSQSVVILTASGVLIPVAKVTNIVDVQWEGKSVCTWRINILAPTIHRSYKVGSNINHLSLDNYIQLPFRASRYEYDINNRTHINNHRIEHGRLVRNSEFRPNNLILDGNIPGIIKIMSNDDTIFFLNKNGSLSTCDRRGYMMNDFSSHRSIFSGVIDFIVQSNYLMIHQSDNHRIIYWRNNQGKYVAKAKLSGDIPVTLTTDNYYYLNNGRLYNKAGIISLPNLVVRMSSQSFWKMILLVFG